MWEAFFCIYLVVAVVWLIYSWRRMEQGHKRVMKSMDEVREKLEEDDGD